MPRRGENIYKRKDGRWEGRYIKTYTSDGKAKYGYVYARSYKQLKSKLKVITETASSTVKKDAERKYSDLLFKWLQSKRITVKESTFTRYQRIVEFYIMPFLGNIEVQDISTDCLEEFVHTLLVSGRCSGTGGLSAKTVNDILVVIKSTLEYGHDYGYQINCNTKHITIKKREREIRVLTSDEQNKLTNYLISSLDLYKLGVLICLYTGIRLGELCAMRWKNFDFDRNVLRIKETLQRIPTISGSTKTKIIITEPKSDCSVREIPLPECLLPFVEKFKRIPEAYILTGDVDKYIEPRTMQYHFHKYIKESGLATANFHSLRHTFATRCVEAGFEKRALRLKV